MAGLRVSEDGWVPRTAVKPGPGEAAGKFGPGTVADGLPVPGPGETFLTSAEVARICRVSPATLRRWRASGLLPAARLPSGHYRYDAAVIARLLARGEQ